MSSKQNQTFVCLIAARSGSKGYPNKNVQPFNGEPLLSRTVKLAAHSGLFESILVSSDSGHYLNLAREVEGVDTHLRPDEISADDTPMSVVIRDACEQWLRRGLSPDFLVLLDVTNPLRNHANLTAALETCCALPARFDGCMSVSEPHFNPAWVVVEKAFDGTVNRWNKVGREFTSRQEAPELFRMNGLFYAWRFDVALELQDPWLESGTYLGVLSDDHQGISIDTEADFRVAEALDAANLYT